jgi:hypothetical protein
MHLIVDNISFIILFKRNGMCVYVFLRLYTYTYMHINNFLNANVIDEMIDNIIIHRGYHSFIVYTNSNHCT